MKRLKKDVANKELQVRRIALIFLDILLIFTSMIGALWIRCDFLFSNIEADFLKAVYRYWAVNICLTIFIYYIFHLYSSLWRFASITELKNVIFAVVLSTVEQFLGMKLLGFRMPRSYPFLYLFLLFSLTTAFRFSYRFIRISSHKFREIGHQKPICTMIVGAGAAGYMIVREMKNSKHLI